MNEKLDAGNYVVLIKDETHGIGRKGMVGTIRFISWIDQLEIYCVGIDFPDETFSSMPIDHVKKISSLLPQERLSNLEAQVKFLIRNVEILKDYIERLNEENSILRLVVDAAKRVDIKGDGWFALQNMLSDLRQYDAKTNSQ